MSVTTRTYVEVTVTADCMEDAYEEARAKAQGAHPGKSLAWWRESNDGAEYTFEWRVS